MSQSLKCPTIGLRFSWHAYSLVVSLRLKYGAHDPLLMVLIKVNPCEDIDISQRKFITLCVTFIKNHLLPDFCVGALLKEILSVAYVGSSDLIQASMEHVN